MPFTSNGELISKSLLTGFALSMALFLPGCGGGQAEKPTAKSTLPPIKQIDKSEHAEDSVNQTITTDSGLQYIDIVKGEGPRPREGEEVTVHYTGVLTDGTKFDSSVDRDQPFTFRIGQGEVIQGWDEGVMTMRVGGKRKLIVPSNLGYGDQGFPPQIPPGATLIFEVDLISIQ